MLLAWMMVLHFVADFLLQSREMGQKKSSEPVWLIRHLLIQWFVFAIALAPFMGLWAPVFALVNAAIHGVIDWNIWRFYKLYAYSQLGKRYDAIYKKVSEMQNRPSEEYSKCRNKWILDNSSDWKYWEDHWFYSTIGLDQLLHILTIITIFSFFI